MFIGHVATGLAASRVEPRLGLGTAVMAAQLPDAIWPVLLLAGVEQVTIAPGDTAFTPLRFDSYPWSHSLVMVVVWGALFGIAFVARDRPRRAGVLVALLAISHWVLDFVTHRPDMPLVPWGGPRLGLGLWNSVPATIAVEGVLFAAAVWFFARGRRLGWSFWVLMAVLTLAYFANAFGPPPPSVTAIAVSGIVLVPVLWWWANRAGRTVDRTVDSRQTTVNS